MMADTPGLDLMNGIFAFVTALFLFAAAAYSWFIKNRLPPGKYSTIFPYLSVGTALLGVMMLVYSSIFLTHAAIIVPVTTLLFFLGSLIMMMGAYKVTQELGESAK